VIVSKDQFTRGGYDQAGDHPEQGGFSASRRSQDAHKFPGVHLKCEVIDYRQGFSVGQFKPDTQVRDG
jgi:hypothetical protein